MPPVFNTGRPNFRIGRSRNFNFAKKFTIITSTTPTGPSAFVSRCHLVGFGGALLTNGCLARGIFDIDVACLKGAVSSYILMTIGIYISGHSPGSASFNADGTPNQTVAKVVATDAATVAVKEAIKVLEDCLDKDNDQLCEAAIEALGEIGPQAINTKGKLLALLASKKGNNRICVRVGTALFGERKKE